MNILSTYGVRVFAALGLVALAFVSWPAGAQRTGTYLDRSAGAIKSVRGRDKDSAILATNTYSQCLARREGASMRKALDLPYGSEEQSKALLRLQQQFDPCLGNSQEFDTLVYTPVLMAGGAAEWFLRTNFRAVDLSKLNGMTDETIEKTDYRARTALEDLGLCVLRQDPGKVRALLETKPSSAEEKAAFQALVTLVGPCVMQDNSLKLNVANLRAVLAYASYRVASKLEAAGA